MKMKRAKKEQQRSAHNAHQPKQQNPNKNKNVRKSLQNINNGKRFEKKKEHQQQRHIRESQRKKKKKLKKNETSATTTEKPTTEIEEEKEKKNDSIEATAE